MEKNGCYFFKMEANKVYKVQQFPLNTKKSYYAHLNWHMSLHILFKWRKAFSDHIDFIYQEWGGTSLLLLYVDQYCPYFMLLYMHVFKIL